MKRLSKLCAIVLKKRQGVKPHQQYLSIYYFFTLYLTYICTLIFQFALKYKCIYLKHLGKLQVNSAVIYPKTHIPMSNLYRAL
jgi:hypothetical protein